MSTARRAARGFTLVEILVVTGIIALLAAIILPVLSRARAESRRVQCASNLKQLGKAVEMYAQNNFGSYPAAAAMPSKKNQNLPSLPEELKDYVSDPNLYRCPADRQGFFKREGSSYEWNTALNGVNQDGEIVRLLGSSRTPMIYDYENFHPNPGTGFSGKNVVFCDGRVDR